MIEQEYYTIRELAERWTKEGKPTTPKQIIHLGIRGDLPIYVSKRAILKTTNQTPYALRFTVESNESEEILNPKPNEPKRFIYLAEHRDAQDFEQVSVDQLKDLDLEPHDGSMFERYGVGLKTNLYDSILFNNYRFIPNDDHGIPVTMTIDCFYVMGTDVHTSEDKKTKFDRAESTYHKVIGLLLREVLKSNGKQSGLIGDLVSNYGDIRGISKSNLENIFADANKEINKHLPQSDIKRPE